MSRGVGRIQRHMEHIANTIEAMLDLLEIIQNLPAARNRDLVALRPYAAQDPLRGGTRTRTGGMTGGTRHR